MFNEFVNIFMYICCVHDNNNDNLTLLWKLIWKIEENWIRSVSSGFDRKRMGWWNCFVAWQFYHPLFISLSLHTYIYIFIKYIYIKFNCLENRILVVNFSEILTFLPQSLYSSVSTAISNIVLQPYHSPTKMECVSQCYMNMYI